MIILITNQGLTPRPIEKNGATVSKSGEAATDRIAKRFDYHVARSDTGYCRKK